MTNSSLNLTSYPSCPSLEPHFDPLYFTVYGVAMTFVCGIGVLGNLLNIAVFTSKSISSPLSYCMVVIALSDIFLLVTSFAQWSLWSLLNWGPIPLIGEHVRLLLYAHTANNVSRNCCVWYMLTLTVVRFLSLKSPFSFQTENSQRRIKLVLLGVLLWSVILHLPIHFELTVINIPCTNGIELKNIQALLPSGVRKNFYYFLAYRVVVSFILTDLVPNVLLWVFSLKILLIVRRTRLESITVKRRLHYEMASALKSNTEASEPLMISSLQEQQSTNVNRIVYALCGKFVLCYALPLANDIIELSLSSTVYKKSTVVEVLVVTGNLLVVVSSACSYIIYLLCDSSYRKQAKRILSDFCAIDGPSYL